MRELLTAISNTFLSNMLKIVEIFTIWPRFSPCRDFHRLAKIFTVWPRFSPCRDFHDLAEIFTVWPRFSQFGQDFHHLAENFKRPKNREDSSDFDENWTGSIAATRTIIFEIFASTSRRTNERTNEVSEIVWWIPSSNRS